MDMNFNKKKTKPEWKDKRWTRHKMIFKNLKSGWHDKGVDTNNTQVGISYPTDCEIRLVLLVQISVANVDRVESAEPFLAWSKVVACAIVE
jgi:hypothetical protein